MADPGSPLPPPPASGTLPPLPPSSRPRGTGGVLRFLLGLLLAFAAVAGVGLAWPDDEPSAAQTGAGPTTTLMTKEAAEAFTPPPGVVQIPGSEGIPVPQPAPTEEADLFGDGPAAAVDEVLAAAGRPTQLLELTIYPSYLFVAYRDPANPGNIDERQWRGEVGEASANLIDDRVDAESEPDLFTLDELGPALDRLPSMVADAPGRYELPTEVTHVIIDRFLPFDERVLVRVYASPTDGRSGGGYVTYTTDGTFVKVCC